MNSRKQFDILNFFVLLAIVIVVNLFGTIFFKRFDLTTEKRYSLTNATIEQINKLDDILFVRVYLEGDLPANYKRLRNATKEILDEFRAYSTNVQYEFIDPAAAATDEEINKVYQSLTEQGLRYNNIRYREGDKMTEKIVFPGAIVSYKGEEVPLNLLKGLLGASEEVIVNNSIQQLEYEFAQIINRFLKYRNQSIAILDGYGGLDKAEMADLLQTTAAFYKIDFVNIEQKLDALKNYDLLIVARPTKPLIEKDKFIIDQFIMKGGKVIWLLEHVQISMDSLQNKSTTMSIPKLYNVEDMLFKYGARINTDLVMDLKSLPIPIVTGYVGNQPKQELFPWPYFPLLSPASNHVIVNNLDAIKTSFASSIDTVMAKGIAKTPLLESSKYSKVVMTPNRVSVNLLREPLDERQYVKPPQLIAVLLEGEFDSNFKNRIPKTIAENPDINFFEKGLPSKQIVVADADIAVNFVNKTTGDYMVLGYDRYTRRQYANKDFMLNAINYLCDDSGLIESRSKEFKIRLLDSKKLSGEREQWRILNAVVPIFLILLMGVLFYFWRKRKFEN